MNYNLSEILSDLEYNVEIVKNISQEDENGCLVEVVGGGCFYLKNPNKLPLPNQGDQLYVYGKGFGFPIRGAIRGENVYFYVTKEELDHENQKYNENIKRERKENWEKNKESFMNKMNNLPEAFKNRILYFMRSDEWGQEFGEYELFVCEEAVKLINTFKDSGAEAAVNSIKGFGQLSYEDQRKIVPEISEGHSGNTFGQAVYLAFHYLNSKEDERYELIRKIHGALCPLVGCEAYGCYASEISKKES